MYQYTVLLDHTFCLRTFWSSLLYTIIQFKKKVVFERDFMAFLRPRNLEKPIFVLGLLAVQVLFPWDPMDLFLRGFATKWWHLDPENDRNIIKSYKILQNQWLSMTFQIGEELSNQLEFRDAVQVLLRASWQAQNTTRSATHFYQRCMFDDRKFNGDVFYCWCFFCMFA